MTYQEGKELARQAAINWQRDFENHNYSYSQLADWTLYFYKLGRKYGLIKEFRENGIL
jgi:hypothetical protein